MNEDLQPLLQKAFFYLKFRLRTKKEVELYLLKKIRTTHWSTADVNEIIKHLEELEYIDDKKFIVAFVEQRNLLKPKGKRVLVQELLKHGVNKDLIDEYFSKNEIDEEKAAATILAKRWPRFRNLDRRHRFEKAASFLMRRGFEYEIVKSAINKLDKENH